MAGPFEPLGIHHQNKSKDLTVWTVEGDCDPAALHSNQFTIEWPPRSGRMQSFPEADRGEWFNADAALMRVVKGQRSILEHFFADSEQSQRPGRSVHDLRKKAPLKVSRMGFGNN
jgi:predicted NUDIX family NTP pyrophosphohydrolase